MPRHGAPQATEEVLSTLNRDGSRRRIRPKLSTGGFYQKRKVVAYGLIALFVAMPYFKMGGYPLILLDLEHRKFHFFGTTLLATDTSFLLIFLIGLAALILLVTALFGRVWCGWSCPQTVYMEFLFRPIERLFEGNATQQRKLDRSKGWPLRRVAKNIVFFFVSMFVAHVFLAYFVGIDQLVTWVQSSPAEHPAGFGIMAGVTVLMFLDFAWFREQTCIVACPYGRFQSVILDRDSMIVGYDSNRGEPRGKIKKNAEQTTGDCVDCGACVQTCPTGIDIRKGLQMECIGCTQCIDACDAIMDRVKRPRGLIRYASQEQLAGKTRKLLRARTVIYPAILMIAVVTFVFTASNRASADVRILRTTSPYTVLDTGQISNQFSIRVTNRAGTKRTYHLSVDQAPDATVIVPKNDVELEDNASHIFTMVLISERDKYTDGGRGITFVIRDDSDFEKRIEHRALGPEGAAK